ncbi:acyl-CoA dehydrogenase family protein [Achromobacter xylosoxidans]|jgi:acyl-CoA dehydrogenase|uniref:Acyl-CoA dehydrogenase n=1 Tax=Achromobacter spanius TaxID=217203 RepID=A0A2S5GPD5_9BURK|nr:MULTISPECIES: acyl-CoA dehydrogenase family protein [Achromobacter]AHC49234.1 Butyryl-CoA dehydrogenase [Achromobacter xylosoxidans NBRC 15126 = ATCC 27061]MDD7991192.1 acyl-CoA dehydrogenase family protein [Achromobacter xylosoxidans]MDQ6212667.1 acyl-CoA dehydrogenase family protein [Achromobacter insolitus]MDZ5613340.1 acyl-CoA dehydrogenase family protein [Achromobacter xylosoxidans]MDZ5624554.1 acyl-CoA dehydrogenase family protein [Achromobacter xylosoxidans]
MALDQETFQLLKDSVQRFVRERLVPAENHLEEHDEVPTDIVADMKELGLFGISIPEEYGGIGLSMAQECEVAYELGQTALAFRSVAGTNIGIGSQGILMDGTPEQKAEYLPRIASGELIISFALTEPDAGSDAASLKTKAVADGSDYVISGTKRFITNAPRAGAFTLMARTGGPGAGGISAFVVPAGLPGLTLGKPDKKMGQKGTRTCDVNLDNVRVPAVNIIGGEAGKGFKTAMKVLDRGRLHISALACGMAQRILQEGVAYAQQRKQFGQRIGDFQLVQAMLADSQAELLAGWALVRETAQRYDAKPFGVTDPEVSMRASCTKMFTTEMVGRVADRGVQIHGGSGYINEFPVERFYRDVRLLRLYEGTTQIQQLVIGKQLMKAE